MEYFLSTILPIFIASLMAGVAFLIRSYFAKIDDDINGVEKIISKLDGKLDQLGSDIRNNTIESVKLRTEINAVWRYIDKFKTENV